MDFRFEFLNSILQFLHLAQPRVTAFVGERQGLAVAMPVRASTSPSLVCTSASATMLTSALVALSVSATATAAALQ